MPRPVIIDTDPGTDDAIAIAMALSAETFNVLGLTTVSGNVSLADATRNALALLQAFGRPDVPVFEGLKGPDGGTTKHAYDFHGESGLTVDLVDSDYDPKEGNAVDFLVESARQHEGALEVIALGPLTNISKALAAEPKLPYMLRQVWVMGGAVEHPGNVTPSAEFNFYYDPTSAHRVLKSETSLTVIGLDVCDRVQVGPHGHRFPIGDSAPEVLCGRLLDAWLRSHSGDKFSMCDPLAVAVAADPSIVELRTAEINVMVDGPDRGRSIAEFGEGNVEVAMEVDAPKALDMIRTLAFKRRLFAI